MTIRRGLLLGLLAAGALAGRPACARVADWQKGISFASWSRDEYLRAPAQKSLNQLASLGANWVAIIPSWYMQDKHSTAIRPDANGNTAGDDAVRHVIAEAHARGLKVMLKPHVDQKDRTWRGDIRPTDPDAWFDSYRSFLLHYAELASQAGVEQLCIGTEYQSMTKPAYSDHWRSLVRDTRRVFHGPLTYAANWGGRTWGEYYQIDWWDALDFIGVDAYFPTTRQLSPSVAEARHGWNGFRDPNGNVTHWVDDLRDLSKRYGKKVLFTEIGFNSRPSGGDSFWNGGPAVPDPQAQANLMEAMFQVFDREPWVAGAFLWTWSPNPNAGGPRDMGMDINNKPAAAVVRRWYGG